MSDILIALIGWWTLLLRLWSQNIFSVVHFKCYCFTSRVCQRYAGRDFWKGASFVSRERGSKAGVPEPSLLNNTCLMRLQPHRFQPSRVASFSPVFLSSGFSGNRNFRLMQAEVESCISSHVSMIITSNSREESVKCCRLGFPFLLFVCCKWLNYHTEPCSKYY